MNENARRNQVNKEYFKVIDTEEKAYWLGFVMADECIYEQETTYRFQINLASKDRHILEEFNKAIESTYKIVDKKIGKNEVSQLKINSKIFCETLMGYGIVPRKSGKEKIPDIREDLKSHFIRGYFDGDGCLVVGEKNGRPRPKFCIVSGLDFLNQFCAVVIELGFPISAKAIQKTGNAYTLNIGALPTVLGLKEYLYSDAHIYLERKYAKFQELLWMI